MDTEELKKKFFDECELGSMSNPVISGVSSLNKDKLWSWIELNALQKQQGKSAMGGLSIRCSHNYEQVTVDFKKCTICGQLTSMGGY